MFIIFSGLASQGGLDSFSIDISQFASHSTGKLKSEYSQRSVFGQVTSVPFLVGSVFGICPKIEINKSFRTERSVSDMSETECIVPKLSSFFGHF